MVSFLSFPVADIFLILTIILLAIASYLDIKKREVEWWLLAASALTAFIYALLGYDYQNILWAVVSGSIIPVVLVVASSEKWMGRGDILFAISASLISGYPNSLITMLSAFLAGSIFGIIYRMVNPKVKALPFGPFLLLGALIGVYFGKTILFYFSNI